MCEVTEQIEKMEWLFICSNGSLLHSNLIYDYLSFTSKYNIVK